MPKPVNAVLVAEDFGRFEQQPGGFDVVAKRNGGGLGPPLLVQKQVQVLGSGVDNVRQEHLQQLLNLSPQVGVGPVAVEVGIGLQHVEVGIHGLFLVGVFVAQPQVFQWRPVATQRFEVSAVFRVKAVLLNAAK